MPAILLEMCVFSAPGVVEFLPALPAALNQGTLQGVWLYTWIKLERLTWDGCGFTAELVPLKDQELTLRFRGKAGSLRINGEEHALREGTVQLPVRKGMSLYVECAYGDEAY